MGLSVPGKEQLSFVLLLLFCGATASINWNCFTLHMLNSVSYQIPGHGTH